MEPWTRVKWTEARQVAELLEWEAPAGEAARSSPQAFFEALKAQGRLDDAVSFLAVALPRYETVVWAARSVRDLVQGRARPRGDTEALRAALLWVQDPSEPRRRAAHDAAQRAGGASPERMAAFAAFFSGGSIAPDNCPPVPAPPTVAGRLAAGAVLAAAFGGTDHQLALSQALEAGERIAAQGVAAGGA